MFNRELFDDLLEKGLCKGYGTKNNVCLVQALVKAVEGASVNTGIPSVATSLIACAVRLNDLPWSTNQARANGVRQFAYEMIQSDGIDQEWLWAKILESDITVRLPKLARRSAALVKPPYSIDILIKADQCHSGLSATNVQQLSGDIWAIVVAAVKAGALNLEALTMIQDCADDTLLDMVDVYLYSVRGAKQRAGIKLFCEA